MGGTFTNFGALKAAMQEGLLEAVEGATTEGHDLLSENVGRFYNSPQGAYQRTGQLRASPQIDGVSSNGDSAIGQFSVNTGTQYDPAGRDTATIYGYAEAGGLLGQGDFHKDTEAKMQSILDKNVKSRF